LLAYGALISHYAKRYGDRCWALVYQTETRFRRETMERARRRASDALDRAIAAGGITEFDPEKPWDFVFRMAVDDVISAKYWHVNLEEPALLILTGSRSSATFLDGDATVCDSSSSHLATSGSPGFTLAGGSGSRGSGPAKDNRPPQKGQPPAKKPRIEPPAASKSGRSANIGSDGRFVTNRQGNQLCYGFNAGTCIGKKGNPTCPNSTTYRHNCSICLDCSHNATECKKPQGSAKKQGGKRQ
jgi:hypothetical protein